MKRVIFRCQILMTIDVWWLVHITAINLIEANRSAIVSLIYPRCPNLMHSMLCKKKAINVKWISSCDLIRSILNQCDWFIWSWFSSFVCALSLEFFLSFVATKSCYYYFNCLKKANACCTGCMRYICHFKMCAITWAPRAFAHSSQHRKFTAILFTSK